MPTIGNMPAAPDATVAADATVLPLEDSTATATEKATVQQLRKAILLPSKLTSIPTVNILATGLMLIEQPGLAAPENRYMTIAQMQTVANARTGVKRQVAGIAKVGATAGWVVGAANDLGKIATLPAAQTGATLVIRLQGLQVGDTITALTVFGSIQSAGNTGSLTWNLRALTNNAAGATDASIDSLTTPISVTANTLVNGANAREVLSTPEVVASDKAYYLLITSTTGTAVTEEVIGVEVELTTA